MQHVQAAFRPEFLNRLDEIILFHRLNRSHMNDIVRMQLNDLANIITTQHIKLEYNDSAVKFLGDKGYDPAFGARPLKRVIQREVQNELAKKILAGKYSTGDTINLSANEGKLIIA